MKNWLLLGAAALTVAGCAQTNTPSPGAPIPIESESISYETGPCFGACPVYAVTVHPDGTGTFVGKRFTEVEGERAFTLTVAQYQTFKTQLAPYRPDSGSVRYAHGEPNCERVVTDMPSVNVTWTRPIGDSQSLYFYFGCRDESNRAIAEALGNAPDALPIQAFIGERP